MGCVSSKIQNDDAVGHCGQRKSFVKQAVSARTTLASAHAKYVQALSSTALAFRQFTDGEFREATSPSSASSIASSGSTASVEESPPSSSEIKDGVPVESAAVPPHPPPPPPRPMRLRSTPTEPITVVLSPPREDFYRPPPPPETWEYPDIFRPPTPLRRYRNIPEEEDDEDEEEDIPSLEEAREVSPVQKRGVVIEEIQSEEEEPKSPAETKSEKNWQSENRLTEVQSEAQSGKGRLSEVQSGKNHLSEVQPGKNEQHNGESKELDGEEDDEDDSSASEEASSRVVDGGEEDGAQGRKEVPLQPMALVDVLRQVEEQFVRAADAGKPVLRMLEARKVHNQLDRGYSDHSSRLLSALSLGTWSPRSLNSPRGDLDHEVSGGLSGSHAATLDRLYAWEKKLYEEVKTWEGMNMELDKKRKILRNLDAKGAKADVIDKTRASMKALETEITVALHAMEASSASIQRITDDEILPQLMELLQLLAEMWREMQDCHKNQLEAATQFRVASGLSPLDSTSVSNKSATVQLESCLNSWHTSLSLFFTAQKDFVRCLKGWISHSLLPDPSSKKNGSKYSKKNKDKPKIQYMCEKWNEALEKIPVVEVTNKIKEYSQTLREIGARQAEEIRIQKRAEHLRKELNKKITSLNNTEKKRNHVVDEEKRNSVDALARKVQEEQQKFNRAIQETRAFTLKSIQKSLPPLFQAVDSFATTCMNAHQALYEDLNSYTVPVA